MPSWWMLAVNGCEPGPWRSTCAASGNWCWDQHTAAKLKLAPRMFAALLLERASRDLPEEDPGKPWEF